MPRGRKGYKPQTSMNPEDWMSDIRREDINFKQLIFIQLSAITRASTLMETAKEVDTFAQAVIDLETLLIFYLDRDKEYQESLKELEKITPKNINELIPDSDARYRLLDYEIESVRQEAETKTIIMRETRRWRAIMRFLAKKGMLFERQFGEVVG